MLGFVVSGLCFILFISLAAILYGCYTEHRHHVKLKKALSDVDKRFENIPEMAEILNGFKSQK